MIGEQIVEGRALPHGNPLFTGIIILRNCTAGHFIVIADEVASTGLGLGVPASVTTNYGGLAPFLANAMDLHFVHQYLPHKAYSAFLYFESRYMQKQSTYC